MCVVDFVIPLGENIFTSLAKPLLCFVSVGGLVAVPRREWNNEVIVLTNVWALVTNKRFS